jgi:hypothetical protein
MIKIRDEIGKLLTVKNYKVGVEVGVQRGTFAKTILSNWDGHLFLVDSWRNFPSENYVDMANVSDEEHRKNLNICLDTMSAYEGRYTICRGLSKETSEYFKDEIFDFVYIDANHSYEGCLEDIRSWIKKIKKGGCICGHDYLNGFLYNTHFEVEKAVLEFFGKTPDIITTEDGPIPSWFIFV